MLTIVSLLDPSADAAVRKIWQRLEDECGLRGIMIFPFPHMSWLGAGACDQDNIIKSLEILANKTPPMQIKTNGLGIFTKANPVMYLPVVKDPELMESHQLIWGEMSGCMPERAAYYAPNQWIPHITLAIKDVTPQRLACAVIKLCQEEFELSISLDNLALVDQEGDAPGILCACYKLRGVQ